MVLVYTVCGIIAYVVGICFIGKGLGFNKGK